MRVELVGADFEENLGIGMIAAAAEAAGHEVSIVPFNRPEQLRALAEGVAERAPDVLGLSIQFQHRAHEFLALAELARRAGYRGHITCGGQFPTLAYNEVLGHDHGVDTVVLHDGEDTFVELLSALAGGRRPHEVPGLAVVADDGTVVRTEARPLCADLDRLPFPKRYRPHARHMGVPFIPIIGGRGCWGACSYCSIASFYRDARRSGGGPTVRLRSPENVAAEMALLTHAVGGPAVFCFHDDNFLLPRPEASLARVRAIREALDGWGVGDVGFIGKCRPETVTPELALELAELGVVRLYVGVENASEAGARHLNRGRQHRAVHAALAACREAGIFVCYNLLIFEPDAVLDDIRTNIAFIRDHAAHPVNFCRAEPYYGTPLHRELAERQDLGGSYLGWNYRIEDDRTELLFRVCASAFRERNFATRGVANRTMGLGYGAKLIERFHEDPQGRRPMLLRRADALTREITLETARFLEEAADLVERHHGDRDRIERETALLGLRIAAANRVRHAQLDEIYADMEAFAAAGPKLMPVSDERRAESVKKLLRMAQSVALSGALAAWAVGVEGCGTAVDPAPEDAGPRDSMVVDAPTADAGVDSMVVDPAPEDAGMDGMVVDPPPADAGVDSMVVDPPPPDAGVDAMVADPAPEDAGMASAPAFQRTPGQAPRGLPLMDQWRDTSPRQAVRTADLPLHDPPVVSLGAERDGDAVRVRIVGAPAQVSTRWEAMGVVTGERTEVTWVPQDGDDQIAVAIRSHGGVAVVTLRARDV